MHKLTAALLLGTALATPTVAFAKDIAVDVKMVRFGGYPAYVAVYITNPDGSYNSTLWVSGSKMKYLGALRQWAQGASAVGVNIDGISGGVRACIGIHLHQKPAKRGIERGR